jgi:hypothetical protein
MSGADAPPTGARVAPTSEPPRDGPIALDGLAYGVDMLDALLVLHLGDAELHASWVRPEGGLRADDLSTSLRDAYRVAQFAGKRLSGGLSPRAEAPAPVLTLEMSQRTAVLRRVRACVVAAIFDAAMPLGMARLVAARLAASLEPELPREEAPEPGRARVPAPPPIAIPAPPPVERAADEAADRGPRTLTFGSGQARRSPPPPRPEADRTSRLLAYLEAHAPDPHVVRHRLALRAGLTLAALERAFEGGGLGPDALVLVETAVQDILGIDRAELRRIA